VPRKTSAALAHARRIARRYEGITGVDLGYIYKNGKRTGKVGVRFHVVKKKHRDLLRQDELLPETMHTCECDVLEAKYAPQAVTPATAILAPGMSIGNLEHRATGTLGLVVTDPADQAACLLSNWHVLAGAMGSVAGETIIHPGPAQLGVSDPPTKIAELRRWTNLAHGYDAAIARLTAEGAGAANEPTAGTLLRRSIDPILGMRLSKVGIASGLTHAIVDGIHGTYPIDYSTFGGATLWMHAIHLVPDPQSRESEITLDGDSGAIWFQSRAGSAVALQFAGEDGLGPTAEYALAHPINDVLSLLAVRIPDIAGHGTPK
jgi:endonuclease G